MVVIFSGYFFLDLLLFAMIDIVHCLILGHRCPPIYAAKPAKTDTLG